MRRALIPRLEDNRVFAACALALGVAAIALRAAWVAKPDRMAPINSEMLWVSQAFARSGHLADAYGPGTGLTAHVTPVMPVVAGTVYRLFGVSSPLSEVALIAISLALVGLSLWGADRALARLGSPAPARLAALAVFALAPLYFSLETQNFRVWEGAAAAAGLTGALALCLRLDQAEARPNPWILLGIAAGGGVMAMISPPVALAIYGLLGLLALRRYGWSGLAAAASASAVLLVAISYPWAARNEAVFGEKVWSRTNFGFNFAQGFHDAAVAPKDPRAVFVRRLAEVDPYTSKDAYRTMKAVGGEQAYSRLWTARTKAWIQAHPGATAEIVVRHLREFFFPPKWFWSVYSDKASLVAPRMALIWLITIIGFLEVAWRLATRQWRYLYILAALALPAAPYVLAQPILRYRYPIAALLTYLAADACWRLLSLRKATKSAPHPSGSASVAQETPT